MSWTLAEFSKIETDPVRKQVIDSMLMESNLLQLVPWETIGQLSTGIVRYQDLPSIGFRNIGGTLSESTGHFEQKTEVIALSGTYIDTDEAIARAKNSIQDARSIQTIMSMKAYAYAFNDKFINGNPGAGGDSAKEFKGISARIDDLFNEGYTDQKIASSHTTVGILNAVETSYKYFQDFIDDLDKLIYAIQGHAPNFLLMNHKTLLAVRSGLRRAGLLSTVQDMFGRNIDMYGSARLVDIGTKSDQSTEIITNAETTVGALSGGTECTSIYAVKFGVGELLWGIQEYPLEVEDKGLLENGVTYRTILRWNLGLADVNPHCMGRLYGVIPDASS